MRVLLAAIALGYLLLGYLYPRLMLGLAALVVVPVLLVFLKDLLKAKQR